CGPAVMAAFSKKGEEKEKAAKETRENLKTLESGLEGKRFFGGETIDFVILLLLIDAETMPLLDAWFKDFLEVPFIKECMPPWDKLLEHNKEFHKILTAAST
ncbi:glutathione transferase gst 23, partial [Quercus suber]